MNETDYEQIKHWSESIRQSDRGAFDELFRYLYPQLVYFAMRFTKQKASACDIVQDAFVILWNKREEIDPEQSLKAYMFKIVKNRSINWIRKSDNNNEPIDERMNHLTSDTDEVNTQASKLSLQFRIWINQLPERQQEAFELSRFEGLNHDEIAEVMNVSPKTVNNHIVAALSTLRERYNQYKQG
jgi:RNA polymerase sigma-70 factor, ECF subfamily